MREVREPGRFGRLDAATARQALRRHGIPAALVTGTDNLRCLVGIQWGDFQRQPGYALLFAEHAPVVFAHAGCYHQLPDQCPRGDAVADRPFVAGWHRRGGRDDRGGRTLRR
jgi:hypothetical protein